MKPILTLLFLAVIIFTAIPSFANSKEVNNVATATSAPLTQKEADRMIQRIKEIQSMDKKALNSMQKRQLREELMVMKKRFSDPGGIVVYLSGTAIVILIIILILLLV